MTKRHNLLSILALVCLIYATFAPITSLSDTQVLQLDRAEFVLDEGELPPPDSAPWKPQPLPDNWNVSRRNVGGFGWYRIRFVLVQPPTQLYAVYAPKISMNAAFYLNGQYLGSGGVFALPVAIARNANRPQFFAANPQLLRSGSNTLHVRIWSTAGVGGGLGQVRIGREVELRPLFEHRYLFQVQLQQISVALIGFVAVLLLFLWTRRPHDTMYGYLGAACLTTMVYATAFVVRDAPLEGFAWDLLCLTALGFTMAFIVLFALRFTGRRWRSFEALLWLYLVVNPFVVALGGLNKLHLTIAFESLLFFLLFVVCAGILARFWWGRRTVESFLVLALIAIDLIIGGHDVGILVGALPFESMFWTPYGSALGSIFAGGILINRFVRNLNDYEKLNVELEGRVAQKHAELEHNYQRMHQLERQSAIVEERQRIMRDMHDGLGAQLISTLSLVEHGDLAKDQLAAVLRECLDDLRLTIDSLESTENDLLTVLGNFRYRLEPRLKSSGIQLDWQVQDLPKLACLTPQNVLHVLRILQEAFTNILKHARANMIKVETGIAGVPGKVYVSVSDNGIGLTNEHPGHGLANMRRRAQAIGGTLDIVSAATGTMITLSLPNA
jgi:signal transduction histidine kinase